MSIKTIRENSINGILNAPTSKSYAQRAVAAALLAEGRSRLTNMDLCNDTRAALEVIRELGATISNDGLTYMIDGGFAPTLSQLNIGESGLATRLFTPVAALSNRKITITGHGSILSRPIEAMRKPLEELGVVVTTNEGFLPLSVTGPIRGGEVRADGSLSSQFITGLLMALPMASEDTILIVSNLKSIPYIDMTIELLANFGIVIEHRDYEEFRIRGRQKYQAADYNIEGDWSGASCMAVAGAIAGEVTIENLNPDSLQADRKIMEALTKAGARITQNATSITVAHSPLHGFEFDATHCPDLFPALVALAANCDSTTTLRGTNRLTHKESDRAATLAMEFAKMGVEVDISKSDIMQISRGQSPTSPIEVSSHNDHRIAMATAVAALTIDQSVTVHGAEAVGKSYPDFWEQFARITISSR